MFDHFDKSENMSIGSLKQKKILEFGSFQEKTRNKQKQPRQKEGKTILKG